MPRRNPPRQDDTLTTGEVAKILGYDPRTVRRHSRKLGAYRLGRDWRFPREAINALVDNTETEAAS